MSEGAPCPLTSTAFPAFQETLASSLDFYRWAAAALLKALLVWGLNSAELARWIWDERWPENILILAKNRRTHSKVIGETTTKNLTVFWLKSSASPNVRGAPDLSGPNVCVLGDAARLRRWDETRRWRLANDFFVGDFNEAFHLPSGNLVWLAKWNITIF
jgi:hypothetical protein